MLGPKDGAENYSFYVGERVDRKEKFQDMLSLQALGNSLSTRVLSTKSNNEVKFSRKVQKLSSRKGGSTVRLGYLWGRCPLITRSTCLY